jgi:hypothetical protein
VRYLRGLGRLWGVWLVCGWYGWEVVKKNGRMKVEGGRRQRMAGGRWWKQKAKGGGRWKMDVEDGRRKTESAWERSKIASEGKEGRLEEKDLQRALELV